MSYPMTGTNAYLMRSTVVAALGGLLFGFDTAVIAGATHALTTVYSLTPTMLGVTVSSALAGTVIGSAMAGGPADRYGRKASLQILAILYVLTSIGCALAASWEMFLFFRALGGLAIGGSSVIGPMYIAEIAPASKRGRLVGMFQFNIVAGILLAYLSNYLIGTMGFADAEWRWKLGIPALPAGMESAADLPRITEELMKRGYTPAQVHLILGENLLHVFEKVEKVSRELTAAERPSIARAAAAGKK